MTTEPTIIRISTRLEKDHGNGEKCAVCESAVYGTCYRMYLYNYNRKVGSMNRQICGACGDMVINAKTESEA